MIRGGSVAVIHESLRLPVGSFQHHGVAVVVANHRARFTGTRHTVKGRRDESGHVIAWVVDAR